MTFSASQKLATEVAAQIAAGEDPLGDNDPIEGEDEGEGAEQDGNEATEAEAAAGDAAGAENEGDDAAAATAAAAEASAAGDAGAEGAKPDHVADKALDEAALRAVAEDDDLEDEPVAMAVPKIDFKAKAEEIEKRESEVEDSWTGGRLSDAERNAQLRQLRGERDQLTRDQARADTIADLNAQRAQDYQVKVLRNMANASKAAGQLDYSQPNVGAAFDRMLTAVAGDPDNAGKSFRDLAQLAHDALCASRGVKSVAAAPTPAAAPAAPAGRTPPKAPITLRSLPTASTPNTGGSALDALANLKGQAYQDAFNRLTPAQKAQLLDA